VGVSYRWYTKPDGNSIIGEAHNYVTPRLKKDQTYYFSAIYQGQESARAAIHVAVLKPIIIKEKVKVNDKYGDLVLTVQGKLDKRYNYLWFDESGKRLMNKGGRISSSMRTDDNKGELRLDANFVGTKVFLQKVDVETTCVSELKEIKIK